ncbi:MAG: hypothetical protein Q7R39_00850, partial [Dehalococcoidia bacterium]|nr:hypothetical protein [Dehalococcoidia bacterium]
MRSIVRRAIPFVATIWIVAAASCAVAPPSPTPTGGPPRIPHSLEGREGRCLLCHQEGVGGAPRVTAAHLGRTNEICTLCHIPAAGNVAHEAAPSGTAPTVASGAAATPASQAAAGNAGPGSIQ